MSTSPDAVYVIIPCMKELGMSWKEIKSTPRHELTGLLKACQQYSLMHQFDGYTADDISSLAKDKPQLRGDYAKSLELNAKYERKAGRKEKVKSFSQVFSGMEISK